MAQWKYRLNVADLWKARNEKKITIKELSVTLAKRIMNSPFFKKHEAELFEIVWDFEKEVETIEEFDGVLETLYNWADAERCWINTFA